MLQLLLTLAVGGAGGLLFFKLKVPGGMMVGALVAVTILSIGSGLSYMPSAARVAAQIAAGAFIGTTVEKSDLKRLPHLIRPAALLLGAMLCLNLIMGLVFHFLGGVDWLTAFLCAVPGGMSDTPIIVLTVEERSSVMHAFLEAGATDYSLKPIKALDLISRIQVHLRYHEHSRMYAASHDKGISQATLQTILDCLRESSDYLDVDEIVERTRIKKKTAYRYLSYLQQQGQVTTQQSYGEAGRPRVLYRLK